MKMTKLSFWAGVILTALPLVATQAQEYAIHLDIPEKAGQKYQLTGDATEITKNLMTVDGTVARQQDVKREWAFEGNVEVTQTGEKGRPTQLIVQVKKFTVKDEGAAREVLPAGTTVTAGLKDGKSTYQVKGVEIGLEAATGLKTFVSVSDPNKPNDDDISGTKDKKKVGDTWPLNTEMAVKNFALNNLQLKKEDVSGTSKLEGVVTEGDQKLLKVSSKIDIKNVAPPLPPGMEVKKSTIQAEFSGLFPLNPAGPRVQSSESMKMDLKAQGKLPDGRPMEISVNSEQKSSKRMKFE